MLTGFIFPAFVSEYSGNETEILREQSDDFDDLLKKASNHLGLDLTVFDIRNNNFQDHELNTQFMSYIFSCAVSDLLKSKKVSPQLHFWLQHGNLRCFVLRTGCYIYCGT